MGRHSLVATLLSGMVQSLILFSSLAMAAPAAHTAAAEQFMAQGWSAWQRGAFEEAVRSWQGAAQRYAQAGQPRVQSEALTQLAHAYQALGQYHKAEQSLSLALDLAQKAGDWVQAATVLGSLGGLSLATGALDAAQQVVQDGLRLAREINNAALIATLLNDLGNVFTSQGNEFASQDDVVTSQKKYAEALDAYEESVRIAAQQHNPALAVRALTNAAMTSIQQKQYQTARMRLDMAWAQMQDVPPSHDKAASFITIGLAYASLSASLSEDKTQLTLHAAAALNAAADLARTLNDQRTLSYALGHLGKLYEEEERYNEALHLTRQATFAAQQVQAPESLYRWQWQTGRLLKALGDVEAAIASYQRAVDTLQSFRQEMVAGSGRSRTSFRETISPVYFGLVDLLLQRAATLPDRVQYEPLLVEARDAVELFKAVELRDYFKDDCVDAARQHEVSLESMAQSAITIYPILLPERTELLLSLPDGLQRVAVPVTAERLTQEVRELRSLLEKSATREYLPHAQQLYNWLIRPLEPALASTTIDTLVFVPDGPLRTIPMAALHDGQQFLIHKYAVATTPGMKLTDPRPLPRGKVRMLAMGLTEGVQGFSALPAVAAELDTLQQLYSAEVLLNQRFLLPSVEKELREKLFRIVHIASHGQFDRDVTKTFLLTFDSKLTMDGLAQMVGRLRFREDTLELLTLSACQTAAGDDRAALGLAGVAIKAGARSALATLWFIDDEASAELITEFYRQLQNPALSRAKALQHAQLKLLSDERYEHPRYWAPFLLLNNWL